ncbi:hypothetical protein FRB99_006308 [Tulasnella sp. 403]|nr:hypothetical protein FRB99_006308 [Tulasnella sp. 403]
MLTLPRLNSQSLLRLLMAGISLLMMIYVLSDSRVRVRSTFCPKNVCTPASNATQTSGDSEEGWNLMDYVNGPPTSSLFSNLRNDTAYVTTLLNAGWTNDVMTIVNMIYLSILTGRVAVIPPHVPVHVGVEANEFLFSDVWDLPRLRRTVGHPMIEWADIKSGISQDHIGCWSVWQTVDGQPHSKPRGSRLNYALHLDISYTKIPENTKLLNLHASFWGLAKLGFPDGREEALRDASPLPSNQHKKVILPDERFMCFDILYYAAAHEPYEWERDYSPAWRFVGRHLRFHPKMVEIAELYLRRMFDLQEDEPIPKFISLHLRRGDFAEYCGNDKETCFPPMSALADAVEEVRQTLRTRRGIEIGKNDVVLTSDEKDPMWWASVAELGWKFADHEKEKTVETYGRWYPPFIDAIHQSMGTGFVGTEGSTMSLVALRRVVDWNGGMGKMVKFGEGMYKTT